MTMPRELKDIIVSDPEILGGSPCFKGTRVPLTTLLDYVESGYSLDRFLMGYSGVRRDQVEAVLQWQSHQSRQAIGLELL